MKKVIFCLLVSCGFFTYSQTTGVFGGDAAASGFPHQANTTGMWVKLAYMTLNGNYKPGTLQVDFYPDEAPHGDSRQTLLVVLRNGNNDFYEENSDIVLVTHYGSSETIRDVKVIQTGGSGSSNNTFSVWVQIGASWVANVPIEVRTLGSVTCFTTNQPYYTSIQETGIEYEKTSTYGMYDDKFGIGTVSPSSHLHINATPISGGGESLLNLSVSDAPNDYLRLSNSTGSNGQLIPRITGHHESDNRVALQLIGDINSNVDNGTKPVLEFSARSANNFVTTRPLFEWTNYTNTEMLMDVDGNLGIGTSTPSARLDVDAGGNAIHAKFTGSYTGPQGIQVRRSGGADIKLLSNYTSFGGGLQSSSALRFSVGGNTLTDASLYINSSGSVGVGTTSPDERLTVKGNIHAEEIKVDLSVPGPDYVFEPDYELRSLEETEEYIKQHKHLPEVPSANEMETNGLELGEMNMILLKKIEELTLYQIELLKRVEEQNQEIELQKNVNMELLSRIQKLEAQ